MADAPEEGNSPRSTSEATPPRIDDSPEGVSQPSSPEEIVTSSTTDFPPAEVVEHPEEAIGYQQPNDEAAAAIAAELMPLLETNEAGTAGGESLPNQSSFALVPIPAIHIGMVSAAVEAALKAEQRKAVESGQEGSTPEMAKDATKQSVDENSDDSNQQFDVEDVSSEPKSSPVNVDLESDSSPIGSAVLEERRGSGSSATEDASVESYSYPKIGSVIEKESSSGIGATENVSLENESSMPKIHPGIPSFETGATENIGFKSESTTLKTSLTIPDSGAGAIEDVSLKTKLSPSKTDTASVEGSSFVSGTPEKARDNLISPKRRSPSKMEHPFPKRSSPLKSPDGLQKQSESQMSTLLEELGIEETKDQPGSSESISEQEQKSMETDECREELEQENNMTIQEDDSQKAQVETMESKDDSEIEEAD